MILKTRPDLAPAGPDGGRTLEPETFRRTAERRK